jgi:hypothetical protein
MLTEEFRWYKSCQGELLREYSGKHLLISGKSVVGAFASDNEAYRSALHECVPGTFIIQECTPGIDSYTIKVFTPGVSIPSAR